MKEPRLPLATSDEVLKGDDDQDTKIYRERKGREAGSSKYPVEGNDNIAQGTPGMVQGFQHGRDPHVEALVLHALSGIVEGKEHRRRLLRIGQPK